MAEVYADIGLHGLREWLAGATKLAKTDERKGVVEALIIISHYLKSQGIEPDLLALIDNLAIALRDLDTGNQPEILTKLNIAPTMKVEEAERKAIAAAAISLAPPRSDLRRKVVARAARLLGVTEAELKNFRANLVKGHNKSAFALMIYRLSVNRHRDDPADQIEDVIWAMLGLLERPTQP